MIRESNIDFLCFGGEDWWYHNRGHIDMQLMRRFAKKGTVLYINSIVTQRLNISQGRKLIPKIVRKTKSILTGLKKTKEGFWVYSPVSLPIQHISWAKWLNEILLRFQIWCVGRKIGINTPIIWVACPTACDIALRRKKAKLVYQRTDRFEDYPDVDFEVISKYDRRLKANADLTIYVNKSLYDEEASQCKKAIYLDHGVDYEMFAFAEKYERKPRDIVNIPRPIVGFFGGIDGHTSVIEFVKKVVDLLLQVNFVFVGNISANCNGLLSKRNVWFLGQKPYEQVPLYGKCFDVAIMPWRQNCWIEACNPIKLKEYLALGKPIVSTPFGELQKYRSLVYQAETPEEFAQCITKALKEDGPERIAARRGKVENDTWDSKAELLLHELFKEKQI